MALTISSQGHIATTQPTIELRIALRDFKDALAEDQRQLFELNIAKPDAESVTLFVADIAARNQGPHGKFLWKRLCPFLEASRQFTGIVNQFISSNPSTAALVWGGIRTALLAANNVTSYFDQVTNVIMEIGRLSPTYTEFGQLYSNHLGLQCALSKYYTLIIRLCIKIVKDSQRSASAHALSTFFKPFEFEFKPILDDLAKARTDIRDQISLAAKQAAADTQKLLELESKANEKHRRFTSRFHSEAKKGLQSMDSWRQKQLQIRDAKMRDDIKKSLSEVDYLKAWRLALQPRVPGTAEWFQSDPEFQAWRSQVSTATMWLRGNMGVGKTVFVANLIAFILHEKTTNETISFHLCRSDQEASLLGRSIIGTIARQILEDKIESLNSEALNQLHNASQSSDAEELGDLILSRLDKNRVHYIILDGLDECQSADISLVQEVIDKLCSKHPGVIKVLYSARPDLEELLFKQNQPGHTIRLTASEVQKDIDTYIDVALDKCLEDEILTLNDPTLILKITKVLKEGSAGMFLWARYFIGELCACISDFEITQALEKPPQGLSKLLDTIMSRVKSQASVQHAIVALKYCGVSKRPLTLEELQEALSIAEGQLSFDRAKMPTDMKRVTSACRGLIFVDEVDDTVHYVHQSLKTYLFNRDDDGSAEFDENASDLALGCVCLTYLNFSDFQRQLSRTYAFSSTPVQPLHLAVLSTASAVSSSKVNKRMARMLLGYQSKMHNRSLQEITRKAEDLLESEGPSRMEQELRSRKFSFLEYAREFWLKHLNSLDMVANPDMWHLFERTVRDENTPASKPWRSTTQHTDNSDLVTQSARAKWIMENEHIPLLRLTTLSGVTDPTVAEQIFEWTVTRPKVFDVSLEMLNSLALKRWHRLMSSVGPSCLPKAVESGNQEVVKILFERPIIAAKSYAARCALIEAVNEGLTDMVEVLLSVGIDPNSIGKSRHALPEDSTTALIAATRQPVVGTELVSILLKAGADVHVRHGDCSALVEAIRLDRIEVIEKLIQGGLDVHQGSGNENPLELAITAERFEIGRRLVLAGADKDQTTRIRKLGEAIRPGNEEFIDGLLKIPMDVNRPYDNRTPLSMVVSMGIPKVVDMLIAAGADINARSTLDLKSDDWVPGAIYDWKRDSGVFKSSVKIDNTLSSFTPLMIAVTGKKIDLVKQLIAAGADIHSNEDIQTLLCNAIQVDPPELLDILLEVGVCPDFSDKYRVLFSVTVENGDLRILKNLIKAGIDVNSEIDVGTGHRFALFEAIHSNRFDLFEELISAGADVNISDDENTPLTLAIRLGRDPFVTHLLDHGADVNVSVDGNTALIEAARYLYYHMVRAVLANNPDPNIQNQHIRAIHMAVRANRNVYNDNLDAAARDTMVATALSISSYIATAVLAKNPDQNIRNQMIRAIYTVARNTRDVHNENFEAYVHDMFLKATSEHLRKVRFVTEEDVARLRALE